MRPAYLPWMPSKFLRDWPLLVRPAISSMNAKKLSDGLARVVEESHFKNVSEGLASADVGNHMSSG